MRSTNQQIVDLPRQKITWFRTQLSIWAKENLRDYPWRKTTEPYNILVAEFLLPRTNADTVAPVYQAFLARYPTLAKLENTTVEDIAAILKPLGLFFRAERLLKTAQIIIKEYAGKIPHSETKLLMLPGIGKYTARAICSQAFQQPVAVMDTNVARILERFFGIKGERVKSRCKILWQAAEELCSSHAFGMDKAELCIAPDTNVGLWNLTLLDFGAIACTARKPKCTQCPLAQQCNWFQSIADAN